VKHVLAAGLLVASLGVVSPAESQVFGQFTGAAMTPVNGHVFGAYLSASNNVIGGLAQLRLSFYPDIDFAFAGGLTRFDRGTLGSNLTTLRLGADLRWHAVHRGPSSPVDVTAGGALAVETGDDFKVVTVGPNAMVSRPLGSGENGPIVPYAGLGLFFINRDAFGIQDTDLSIPLRLGLEARVATGFQIVAEMQLYVSDRYNDDVSFATGVNLPF
jgi:hypothetical protein